MTNPNPLRVGWSILGSRRVVSPHPTGDQAVDHSALASILSSVAAGSLNDLPGHLTALNEYLRQMQELEPDEMDRPGALAFWLNLYNAGALALVARARQAGESSVLRLPGAFTTRFARVAGEDLSLDNVEHGKIRRFGDPRIHAALVCGSASCPTLRYEPFTGDQLDEQLDDQMRRFLSRGGAVRRDATLYLSRVFKWYGADFVRPARMPTLLPASRRAIGSALAPWLEEGLAASVGQRALRIDYQPYDWALACSIG